MIILSAWFNLAAGIQLASLRFRFDPGIGIVATYGRGRSNPFKPGIRQFKSWRKATSDPIVVRVESPYDDTIAEIEIWSVRPVFPNMCIGLKCPP